MIGGAEELARWSAFAARRGRTSPCALHFDTGMNRLGFPAFDENYGGQAHVRRKVGYAPQIR